MFTFNPQNSTFHAIISANSFSVPKFQRDYCWEDENWEDLWQDIVEQLERKDQDQEDHYMGYLVFEKKPDSNNELVIIDGQQRLTTLMIIIIAVRDIALEMAKKEPNLFEDKNKKEEYEELKKQLEHRIFNLKKFPRLSLNKNAGSYFRIICSGLFNNISSTSSKLNTEKLLKRAREFFIKKIKNTKLTSDPSKHLIDINQASSLDQFVEKICNRLFFTLIEVNNDFNAYKIFETLNARGVGLSVPDLIKNHLFSIISNKEENEFQMQLAEDMWNKILQALGEDCDFSKFLYVNWHSRKQIPKNRRANFFKLIKQEEITNYETLTKYLDNLLESSEIYSALNSKRSWSEKFWKSYFGDNGDLWREAQSYLKSLTIFGFSQPFALLIAVHNNLSNKDFIKVLKYIETISIRRNVIGEKATNDQETLYNQIAIDISNKKITSHYKVKEELRKIYEDDEKFERNFLDKSIKDKKKASHLLQRIENFISEKSENNDDELTLEHIYPQNADENNWNQDLEDMLYKLGNLTLLQEKINKKIGNKSFEEKKEIYLESKIEITKEISKYPLWDAESVDKRQNWLAKQAVKCWKIDF